MQVVDSKAHLNQMRMRAKTLSARIACWAPAFLLVVLMAMPAHAQFRTAIQGTVTDTTFQALRLPSQTWQPMRRWLDQATERASSTSTLFPPTTSIWLWKDKDSRQKFSMTCS